EPKRTAIEEHAGCDAGAPEQTLHATMRGCLELTLTRGDSVEVFSRCEHLHYELPNRLAILGLHLAHRIIGTESFPVVHQRDLELGRDRALSGSGVAPR